MAKDKPLGLPAPRLCALPGPQLALRGGCPALGPSSRRAVPSGSAARFTEVFGVLLKQDCEVRVFVTSTWRQMLFYCSEVFSEVEGTGMNVLFGLNLAEYLVVGFLFVCILQETSVAQSKDADTNQVTLGLMNSIAVDGEMHLTMTVNSFDLRY